MVPTAIFLFDRTGNMARPWADAGYRCICYDIQHVGRTVRDGIIFQQWDALLGAPAIPADSTVVFGFAFPPCTDLAVSGARWFKEKGLRRLAQAIEMVAVADEFLSGLGVPYGIENPVSVISSHWRKPDYTFHPYEFTGFELSDNYTKKTCIWAGGGFEMPAPNRADGLGAPDNRIHAAPHPMTAVTSARLRRSGSPEQCLRRTRSSSLPEDHTMTTDNSRADALTDEQLDAIWYSIPTMDLYSIPIPTAVLRRQYARAVLAASPVEQHAAAPIEAPLRVLMGAVNAYEKETGIGGWYAERIQESCNSLLKAAGSPVRFGIGSENPVEEPAPSPADERAAPSSMLKLLEWAVGRWEAEVKNRPLINVHRRSLDDTWRQVIRHCGGDDVSLLGPRHGDLLAANPIKTTDRDPSFIDSDLDFEPSARHAVADMANIGYALLEQIDRMMPGYHWNESPVEIVSDLINERDEARAASANETGAEGADEPYLVMLDVRDLFAYLRAAWREGQHYDREDMPDQADSWSAASDYANKTIERWTSMRPVTARSPAMAAEAQKPFGWAQPKGGNYFTRNESSAKRIGGLVPVYTTPQPAQADARVGLTDEQLATIRLGLTAAKHFIANGIELGFIRMPDANCPDPAHDTPKLVDEALALLQGANHA